MVRTPASKFWNGKRVFLTSPTSFLGTWTALSLRHLGAQVFCLAEEAASSPNLFDLSNLAQTVSMTYGDLRNEETCRQVLNFAQADVVLHLGESGLLQQAEKKPLDVISKSVMGTAVLMELLRETASVRSVVVASSDKVYERNNENKPFVEGDKVAAGDLLPTAKLCAEFIALSYRSTYFTPEKYNKHKIAVATARLGSAIGGGDFSETSLIPQAAKCFVNKTSLEVRNPNSVRPWIHVLDQVSGLLLLAEALYEKGPKLAPTYNLGASDYESVEEVLREFAQAWGAIEKPTEAGPRRHLSLHGQMSSELALQDLGWQPKWDLSAALNETAGWYRGYYLGAGTASIMSESLNKFFPG